MDKIIRCITSDGAVMASVINSTDIVYTAQKLHSTSPAATAAIGRLLSAASMMGAQLKQKSATLTVRIKGDGPLGTLVTVADSNGNVRGYLENNTCETEHYRKGKINVSAAVGKKGYIDVMRDYGTGEPYMSRAELATGEIAEDITSYYVQSEQIPTACGLGVLLDKDNGEVMLAGGFLIQLLPGADDTACDKLEKNIAALEPMTTMLAKGMSVEEICRTALQGFEVEIVDELPVHYVCNCSRERVINSIASLRNDEIQAMIDEDEGAEVVCNFCNKRYVFGADDLRQIIELKAQNEAQK